MKDIKIITLDTETLGLDGEIKRIAIYDGYDVFYGYKFSDVLPTILDYCEDFEVHIYIHNLDFDARKLDNLFYRGNIDWGKTIKIGSKLAIIKTIDYTLHDSFKIVPSSLSTISKDFDLEHGKIDLWEEVNKKYPNKFKDIEDFFINCDVDDELYLKYLGYDVISLYELLYKLMDILGIEEKKFVKILSTASLSRYVFKNGVNGHQFKTNGKKDFDVLVSNKSWNSKKKLKNSNISYLELEYLIREAFYGGRTEVFIPFSKKAFHYDVNSLYPYVMLREYPIGYADFIDDIYLAARTFKKWQETRKGLGFVKARVFIPHQNIPPLPIKREKLIFPCGYVEGCWTYVELDYAIKHCGVEIVDFIHIIHFKKVFKVFHNLISFFYDWKERGKRENKKAITNLSKLIMNTSYGWTVLRRDDKTCFRDIEQLYEKDNYKKLISKSEKYGFIEIWADVRTTTIQVQVGSYVSSYGRLVLLEALRTQDLKGKVFYCDTDSIVCEKPLPKKLVDSYELGKWDLEKEIERGYFIQPKVYYESAKDGRKTKKFKGVSRKVVNSFNEEFYKTIIEDIKGGKIERKTVEEMRKILPSLSTSLKNNDNPNNFKISDKSINLKAQQKRNINYKENYSEPLFFSSFEEFNNFRFHHNFKEHIF